MYTCTKKYEGIPFAHRQHAHDGHCAQVHGHNWTILFTFGAKDRDENGFVVDFGKLKSLKKYVNSFDHALVLNRDDPEVWRFSELEGHGLVKLKLVDDGSCEGLARHFAELANRLLLPNTRDARCLEVTVHEDHKNSATYHV